MSFDIIIGRDSPAGPFDIVILPSDTLVLTQSWDPMIYNQSEPVAAERVLPLFIVDDVTGDPTAVTIDKTNVQLHKRGGSWANATNDPTALSGQTGAWELQLTAGELDTIGPLGWRVIATGVRSQISWEQVRPAPYLWKGTAQAGASGSITLDTGASATNSIYNGGTVQIIGGTGVGQARKVTAYNGTTKVASINHNWITNPDSTSLFQIYPTDMVLATADLEPVWDAVRASHATAGSFGEGAASVQGNVTGSVASVSGNVTGSVGSVAAAGISHASFAQDALDTFCEVRRNTATAGAASTITLDASAPTTTGIYIDHIISIVGGTGIGQARRITAYTSGRVASVIPNWTTNPDATSVFVITADAQADVGMLRNSLVNALVSGRLDVSVGAMAASVLTATAINSAALTSAKFDNSVNIQVVRTGTAQGGAGATITLDASASATNDFYKGQVVYIVSGTGLGQARGVSGYVGATKVASVDRSWATNPDNTSVFQILPVDSFLRAADVTSIQSGLATSSALATVQADTDDIQSRLPAALVGGKMDSHVNDIASGAITATAIADAAIDRATFAQDALDLFRENRRNTAQTGSTSSTIKLDAGASSTNDFYDNDLVVIVGGTGIGQARAITAYVGATKVATISPNWVTTPDNTSVFVIFSDAASAGGGGASAATIAAAVWDEALAGHVTAGTAGLFLGNLTNAGISDAVWDELLAGHAISGSTGAGLTSAAAGGGASAATIAAAVWDEAIAGHIAAGTVAESLNNASSASSPSSIASAVWEELLAGHATVGSSGYVLQNSTSPAAIADAVWDEARAGHATSGTFGEGVPVTSIAANAITAAAVATDAVTEIQSGLATAANLATTNTTVNTLNTKLGTPAGASVSADVAVLGTKIGTPAGASVSADVAAVKADTGTTLSQVTATASKIADISKVQLGRWKIQGTQLILYEDDGTTPFTTFNLLDDTGSPSNTRVFERVPVP